MTLILSLNGLNGYFTLNFHYYVCLLRYLFTVDSVYTCDLQISAGSGVEDRDPWKNCGSFLDAISPKP